MAYSTATASISAIGRAIREFTSDNIAHCQNYSTGQSLDSILETRFWRLECRDVRVLRRENRGSRIEKQGIFEYANSKRTLRKRFISRRMNSSRSHAERFNKHRLSARALCQLAYKHETTRTNDSKTISGYLQILKMRKLSSLGIREYASSSLYIHTDRNPFSKDGERLKADKEPHCTLVITQTTACASPGCSRSPIRAHRSSILSFRK